MTHVIPSATLQRCNTSITQIDGQPLKKQRAVMVDRPPVSVQTAAGTTVCEAWTWPSLMVKSPDWSIGQHRSCGVLGGHCEGRPA
jgi:hypothetical protein